MKWYKVVIVPMPTQIMTFDKKKCENVKFEWQRQTKQYPDIQIFKCQSRRVSQRMLILNLCFAIKTNAPINIQQILNFAAPKYLRWYDFSFSLARYFQSTIVDWVWIYATFWQQITMDNNSSWHILRAVQLNWHIKPFGVAKFKSKYHILVTGNRFKV